MLGQPVVPANIPNISGNMKQDKNIDPKKEIEKEKNNKKDNKTNLLQTGITFFIETLGHRSTWVEKLDLSGYLFLTVNEYHSNIPALIEKALNLRNNILNVIGEHKTLPETLKTDLIGAFYNNARILFLEKNKFLDFMLQQRLVLFNNNVDYKGFEISEKLWKKVSPHVEAGIQSITSIASKVWPNDKLACIYEALTTCNCEGADDAVPVLCYLMMKASMNQPPIHWNAEYDYMTTVDPDCTGLILQGVITYFSTTSMRKKNDIIVVDCGDAIVNNTVQDIACLWQDIKKEKEALSQIELLYDVFLLCGNNLSGVNEIKSPMWFASWILNSHFMKKIITRIQFVSTKGDSGWTVQYADFIDPSIFAKIVTSFAELKIDK